MNDDATFMNMRKYAWVGARYTHPPFLSLLQSIQAVRTAMISNFFTRVYISYNIKLLRIL